MSAVASTLTFTAGQFKYIDNDGTEHTVTASQTLSLAIDDNSTTDVRYSFKTGQSITTTDGRSIQVCARADGSNTNLSTSSMADANDGVNVYTPGGEFDMIYNDGSNCIQHWKIAQLNASNVDFNASGTITMILEDQFGHKMSIPFQLISTVAVGQAA